MYELNLQVRIPEDKSSGYRLVVPESCSRSQYTSGDGNAEPPGLGVTFESAPANARAWLSYREPMDGGNGTLSILAEAPHPQALCCDPQMAPPVFCSYRIPFQLRASPPQYARVRPRGWLRLL